jgi:hypothetical protein
VPIINGIQFYEDADSNKSPRGQYATANTRVTRTLFPLSPGVPSDEVFKYAAVKALLGYAVKGGVFAPFVSRTIPSAFPYQPDALLNPNSQYYLWATSIPQQEPLAKVLTYTLAATNPNAATADGTPGYASTRWSVEYNALTYYIFNDATALANLSTLSGGRYNTVNEGLLLAFGWANSRYITKRVQPAARIITLRQGLLQSNASSPALATPVPAGGTLEIMPITQYRANVKYIWHDVPYNCIPWNAITSCAGAVNNGPIGTPPMPAVVNGQNYVTFPPFTTTFDGYAPGTLLFSSVDEFEPRLSPYGQRLVDLAYNFIYQPNWTAALWADTSGSTFTCAGHNSLPRIDPNTKNFCYWPVSGDGLFNSSVVPFRTANFATLFNPDQ